MMVYDGYGSGWWFFMVFRHTSEKYDFVSWDDDSIPKIWKNNPFMFQTTNQGWFTIASPTLEA
jgi:hypothetical protein